MSQIQSPCITTSMVLSTAFDLGQSQSTLPPEESNGKENPLTVTTRIVFRMDQSLDTTLNASMYWPTTSYNYPASSYAGGWNPMPFYDGTTETFLPNDTLNTFEQSTTLNIPSLGIQPQQQLFNSALSTQPMTPVLGMA